jgi:hypothetical protein
VFALIIIFGLFIYTSVGILSGKFWADFLDRSTDIYSEYCICWGIMLGIVWPVSAFIMIIVKASIRWVNWLVHKGGKIATWGVN